MRRRFQPQPGWRFLEQGRVFEFFFLGGKVVAHVDSCSVCGCAASVTVLDATGDGAAVECQGYNNNTLKTNTYGVILAIKWGAPHGEHQLPWHAGNSFTH